jgi:hypothetical protein
MIVYVAGPYSASSGKKDIDLNIEQAFQVSAKLWEAGFTALCPHGNTYHFEKRISLSNDEYVNRDLELVSVCEAMVMTPDWETSRGAIREKEHAEMLGIPVYIFPSLPEPENAL